MSRFSMLAMLAALTVAFLLPAQASAQKLPDVNCFSPGLEAFFIAADDGLSVRADFDVGSALYARDLTVLGDMLSGTSFLYDGAEGFDRLRILKGGDMLLDAARVTDEGGTSLCVDGTLYVPNEALLAAAGAVIPGGIPAPLAAVGRGIWGRLPLEQIESMLLTLAPGDAFVDGLSVARAFTGKRTLPEDGASMTRLDISGALLTAEGGVMEVDGFFRRPSGREPTDSFELQFVIDEDNLFTVSGSAKRSAKVTRQDQEGTNSVQLRLTSQGRWQGSRIESRVTVHLTNEWVADAQGALGEAITASLHVGHTDKTPGRRMLRLNDISGDLRTTLQLTTRQGQGISAVAAASIELVMDGNTFLDAGMNAVLAGGFPCEAPDVPPEPGIALKSAEDVRALAREKAFALAQALYTRLGESSLAKIRDGLVP